MLRRLFLAAGIVFALCVLLTSAVHTFARRDPPPRVAALLPGDPACAAPCWQGLQPGPATPLSLENWFAHPPHGWQAVTYPMRGAPLKSRNWQVQMPGGDTFTVYIEQFDAARIDRIALSMPGLELGDLLAALGEPDFIDISPFSMPASYKMFEVQLWYVDSQMVALCLLTIGDPVLVAQTPVQKVEYEQQSVVRPASALEWGGLGRLPGYNG